MNRKHKRQENHGSWLTFVEELEAGAPVPLQPQMFSAAPRKRKIRMNKHVGMPRFRSLLPSTWFSGEARHDMRPWWELPLSTGTRVRSECLSWLHRHSLVPHENFAEKHCWCEANEDLTGLSVARAQALVVKAAQDSGMSKGWCKALLSDRTTKEQITFGVAALAIIRRKPSHYAQRPSSSLAIRTRR